MNRCGQVGLPIPGSVIAIALVLSIAQALEVEAVTIPTFVWEFVRLAILFLVGMVAWFLRKTYNRLDERLDKLDKDHKERLQTLEERLWELKTERRRDVRNAESGDGP